MSGIVRVSCVICGDRQIASDQVTLWTTEPLGPLTRATFRCSGCGQVGRTSRLYASDVEALRAVDVPEQRIPAEALEVHDGPPISSDELLTLAVDLAARDDLVALLPPLETT